MATILKQLIIGTTTLLTTELNSLANNTNCVSTVVASYNNTIGSTGDGSLLGEFELNLTTPGGTFTANTGISVWLTEAQDGTNFEYGDASLTPPRLPNMVFAVATASTAMRLMCTNIPLPIGIFRVVLRNDGTGQTLNASGSTLKVRAFTPTSV